jgi:hypothetical protein
MDHLIEALNFFALTWEKVLLGLLLFVATSAGGIALGSFLLVKLPATYFCNDHPRDWWVERHPIILWIGWVLKNVLGVAAVFLGVMLSLPGIPGPGVLLILLGVTLVDFPGKRRFERWLVSGPKVLNTVNRLRQRYGKPPLVLEQPVESPIRMRDQGNEERQRLVAQATSVLPSRNGAHIVGHDPG